MYKKYFFYSIVLICIFSFSSNIYAANAISIPKLSFGSSSPAANQDDMSLVLQILFLLTILSLAPAILIMVTSFTRIIVSLSFLRHAIGVPQVPPNQILIGLALILTFFIMSPIGTQVNNEALQPYLEKKITQTEAFEKALLPIRKFMFRQTRETDMALMIKLSKTPKPKNFSEIGTLVLIPAFVISELKTAFQIGFMLYIPFLIIDMVVSCILMSMGMVMLPPIMISLPFKLLLFIMADGWHLITQSLVNGFH
ncbi:MAG: flagellar type III secretion system pore protein FliP [Candidatus Firestonebacteria bacterium]|nr:flagellar type III secretion system pore protein FliP [Candidatus Firestonebacteria bacterium]